MKHSIIPLFIPHYGCPHQCIFCNQVRITGQSTPVTAADVEQEIREYLESSHEKRYWEAAFYGGSFTALPMDVMCSLLEPASRMLKAGKINGIRLSTRPDAITPEILDALKSYGVSTVELGVQSLDSRVLKKAERGHTAQDAGNAVKLLRKYGFSVGLQFMAGLPFDDWQSMRYTARMGVRLRPDFIRIYPVLVLKDTKLGAMYKTHQYKPLSMKETIVRTAFLKRWYNAHGVHVIRIGLQATEELDKGNSLLAGPYHPSMGELADQMIARNALKKVLLRISRNSAGDTEVIIRCHPKDRSRIMGHHRESYRQYENMRGIIPLVIEDRNCPKGFVSAETSDWKEMVLIDTEYGPSFTENTGKGSGRND